MNTQEQDLTGFDLRAQDVAEILHINIQSVYRLCREGRIPHRRLGLGYHVPIFFNKEDIDTFCKLAGFRNELTRPEQAARKFRGGASARP